MRRIVTSVCMLSLANLWHGLLKMFASMEYEVFMTEGSLEVKLPEVGRVKEEKKRK